MDAKAEIERLRAELEQHNYNYYVKDAPTISDFEYDRMLRQLEQLEAEHPDAGFPHAAGRRTGAGPFFAGGAPGPAGKPSGCL